MALGGCTGVFVGFESLTDENLSDARKKTPKTADYSRRVRMLHDNGTWIPTLARENVELVTGGIAEITDVGVRTDDGAEHACDVLVYATGFTATRFLAPMVVTGRDGRNLHEQWHGEPRAYLGLTVPGFPNLFTMYGPNTEPVVQGSSTLLTGTASRGRPSARAISAATGTPPEGIASTSAPLPR